MKYLKNLLVILLLLAPLRGYAADIEFGLPDTLSQLNFWDDDGRFIGNLATSPPNTDLDLWVEPVSGLVDDLDYYNITIVVPEGGLSSRGGLSFLFPEEFGLNNIEYIEYSDNYDGDDLEIKCAFIHNQTLAVLFERGQSPPAGTEITFSINYIRNPIVSQEYQIVGLAFGRWFYVYAGPSFSERFEIMPGATIALHIDPAGDIQLPAGEYRLFSAFGVDEFGNIISGIEPFWTLNGDIGILNDGLFQATTTGEGFVTAEYGTFNAQSGTISVTPGELSHFTITNVPDTITAGVPFKDDVIVAAHDAFENIKYDYDGIVYFESTDPIADLPFVAGSAYQFTPDDNGARTFDGEDFVLYSSGQRSITAANGEQSGTSPDINVLSGPIASFEIGGDDLAFAGQTYSLSVFNAVDQYGNSARGEIVVELFSGNSSPDGTEPVVQNILVENGSGAAEQYFYAAEKVIIQATSINGFSQELSINVEPGETGDLVLDIQPTQFMGHPLFGPATLTVYDSYGNLKTNFDASSEPVEFVVLGGNFEPSILDGANDFVAGIADLEQLEITFKGTPGEFPANAKTESVLSNTVNLTFNGIRMELAQTIGDTIYVGQELRAYLELANDGSISPSSSHMILSGYFASCQATCIESREMSIIEPGEFLVTNSELNTNHLIPDSEDTLIIRLDYTYTYNEKIISLQSILKYTVFVKQNYSLVYIENSLSEDSVISPGIMDSLSIMVQFGQIIPGETDRLSVDLMIHVNESQYARLGSVYIDGINFGPDPFKIIFEDLRIPDISLSDFPENGYRELRLESSLWTGGENIDIPDLRDFDSLYIVKKAGLSYINGSLTPLIVSPGSEVQFEFDINHDGTIPIEIDTENSGLILYNSEAHIRVPLSDSKAALEPGANHLITEHFIVPDVGSLYTLSAFFELSGTELNSIRNDSIYCDNDIITVGGGTGELRINKTFLDPEMLPNIPFVNTNQLFDLIVELENLSSSNIDGAEVTLSAENGQDILASMNDINIPANSTTEVCFNLVAPPTSIPVWTFLANVTAPGVTVLPPIDNIAVLVVEKPSEIELVFNVSGTYDQFVEIDHQFTISAFIRNLGESEAGRGEISLVIGSDIYGLPDSVAVSVPMDSLIEFELMAPLFQTSDDFILKITEVPVDKNTEEPAATVNPSHIIPITVITGGSELIVDAVINPSPLVIEGNFSQMFALNMTNLTQSSLNVIGLNSIGAEFRDGFGNLISPAEIMDIDNSGYFENGNQVSDNGIYTLRLISEFSDFTIGANESRIISFSGQFNDHINYENFAIAIDSRDILARYISGPREGQTVTVGGGVGGAFEIGGNFVVTSPGLEESIIARRNPFNPEQEPAEISYFLPEDTHIEITIFTLTGEKVFEMDFPAGSEGGKAGDNIVFWNGDNARDHIVMNGVYIVVLHNTATGETYRYKLAVLK